MSPTTGYVKPVQTTGESDDAYAARCNAQWEQYCSINRIGKGVKLLIFGLTPIIVIMVIVTIIGAIASIQTQKVAKSTELSTKHAVGQSSNAVDLSSKTVNGVEEVQKTLAIHSKTLSAVSATVAGMVNTLEQIEAKAKENSQVMTELQKSYATDKKERTAVEARLKKQAKAMSEKAEAEKAKQEAAAAEKAQQEANAASANAAAEASKKNVGGGVMSGGSHRTELLIGSGVSNAGKSETQANIIRTTYSADKLSGRLNPKDLITGKIIYRTFGDVTVIETYRKAGTFTGTVTRETKFGFGRPIRVHEDPLFVQLKSTEELTIDESR